MNKELKTLQKRASKLINDDYYDAIRISELQLNSLTTLMNAKSHHDINAYLWNTGFLYKVLDTIAVKLKEAKIR